MHHRITLHLTCAVAAGALWLGAVQSTFSHGIDPNGGAYTTPAERPAGFWAFLLSVAKASARLRIDSSAGYRYIDADALPDHPTGQFPGRGNPHSITPQKLSYRVPLTPKKASWQVSLGHQPFGVALNGVPFDPLTAEYWDNDRRAGWNIEALSGKVNLGLDQSNAHVQPDGTYHYHGLPVGLLRDHPFKQKPTMLGYAADGFPIYAPWSYTDPRNINGPMTELTPSYHTKKGTRPNGPGGPYDGTYVQDYEYRAGSGDLDKCNGRDGITPDYPQGTYYYVITTAYPFIPRCFTGNPDSSFDRHPTRTRGGPEGQRPDRPQRDGRRGRPGGGPPDLGKAAARLGISPNALRKALGPPPPNFDAAAKKLGISPDTLINALHPNGGGPRR